MADKTIRIMITYTFFAVLSTIINIGSQIVLIRLYNEHFAVEISILVGTATGLLLRNFLEKRYIFAFYSKNLAHDIKLFVLYSAMGVIATIIFWGTEYAFHFIYENEVMRYFGGVIGLTIGFYLKYHLDKMYVFVNNGNELLL